MSPEASSDIAPDFILFAQHGWADNNQHMAALAQSLATESTLIVAPSLNYAMTWLRIVPLIQEVEQAALAAITRWPEAPFASLAILWVA